MPWNLTLAAVLSYDSGTIGACFFYAISGVIAGTVASFVVRGKLGCVLGNFVLGLIGAFVGSFLINFVLRFLPHQDNTISVGFLGTTIIASITATLIAYIVHWSRVVERRQQQQLLRKFHENPPPQTP